jgi:hypothetical protein
MNRQKMLSTILKYNPNHAVIFILLTLLHSGCSSITKGQTQSIYIDTPLCPRASCETLNADGRDYLPATPGILGIERNSSELNISCNKGKSHQLAVKVKSGANAALWGNIIAGGIIGGVMDAANGSGFDYPEEIIIPLECDTTNNEMLGNFQKQLNSITINSSCLNPILQKKSMGFEFYSLNCPNQTIAVFKCNAAECTKFLVMELGDTK